MLDIKIKLAPEAKLPTQGSEYAAGYDLYACNDIEIHPGCRDIIKTGIFIEIPFGYYGRIAPRSGLAWKHGADVFAGVIDPDYRNEVGVVLFNSDNKQVLRITKGMRVAQLIIEKCHKINFIEVNELSQTERGAGGYGSTGN